MALGDARGVQDLQVALELVGQRGTVAGRAMTNLGWAYNVTGDLRRSNLLTVEAIELAEREGDVQGAWFTRTNLVDSEHVLGRWDEALRLVDLLRRARGRAAVAGPRPIHSRADPRGTRPWRRGNGGDRRRARDMRTVGDVQVIWGVLNDYGRLARRLGRVADANSALSELMDGFAMHESVAIRPCGIRKSFSSSSRPAGPTNQPDRGSASPSPWRDVCSAVAERRFVEAADILAAAGEQTLQAELRLFAARQLVGEGRQAGPHCSSIAPGHLDRCRRHCIPPRGGRALCCRELAAAAPELDGRLGRASHASMPPFTTGCASNPCAARMLAAITARGPASQIVMIGLSRGRGLAEREQAVRDVAAAGDVARVALLLLAYVDQLGPVREEGVELLDRDELERLRSAAET